MHIGRNNLLLTPATSVVCVPTFDCVLLRAKKRTASRYPGMMMGGHAFRLRCLFFKT